jgi:signal-transduction protein with cAMP-binding, CBS, and nucleotidyltransferase domain
MMEKICPLSLMEIDALKKDFEVLTFINDFDIVYEDQVPCTGIVIIEGKVEFIKNSKVQKTLHEGYLIGVYHLINEYPTTHGCRIKAKSKIILLGKSDILELKQTKNSQGHSLLKGIFK